MVLHENWCVSYDYLVYKETKDIEQHIYEQDVKMQIVPQSLDNKCMSHTGSIYPIHHLCSQQRADTLPLLM